MRGNASQEKIGKETHRCPEKKHKIKLEEEDKIRQKYEFQGFLFGFERKWWFSGERRKETHQSPERKYKFLNTH